MKTTSGKTGIMIVEHDTESSRLLEKELQRYGYRDIVIVDSYEDSKKKLQEKQPDLLYLGVTGEESGGEISLLDYIAQEQIHTHVVAMGRAGETNKALLQYSLLNYMNKPITPEGIEQSLGKFEIHKHQHQVEHGGKTNGQAVQLIEINGNKEIRYYQPNRILLVEADGNYSHLYMEDGRRETVTQNLGKIEEKLPEGQFMRISRKSIVNTNYIRRLNKQTGEMELECAGKILKTNASLKYMNNKLSL